MGLIVPVTAVCNGLLDLLYPPKCLICGVEQPDSLCPACETTIIPLVPPFCDRCGAPTEPNRIVCATCETGPDPSFAWSQVVGQYAGTLRLAIHLLKYKGKPVMAEPLGRLLAKSITETHTPLIQQNSGAPSFDVIVPVPLHPSRQRERGFNQAERLGRVVARERGWKLDTNGLRRVRNTRTQTELTAGQRLANVHGAFNATSPLYFERKSVLLIDDVLTTSATMGECARVIRNAGAKRVCLLALARG